MRLPVPSTMLVGSSSRAPSASCTFTWAACGMSATASPRIRTPPPGGPNPKARRWSARSSCSVAPGIASRHTRTSSPKMARISVVCGSRSASVLVIGSPECQAGRRVGHADELDAGDLADHDLGREHLAAAKKVAADARSGRIGERAVRMEERPVLAEAYVAGESDDLMVGLRRELAVAVVVLLVVRKGGSAQGTDDGDLCCDDAVFEAEAFDLLDEVGPRLEAADEAASGLELLESRRHRSSYSKCFRLLTMGIVAATRAG